MRQEKQLLMEEVSGQIDQYGSFLIMEYQGLTANALHRFRTAIAQRGGEVEMMRKRILVKAAKQAGLSLSRESLTGHIGLVYTPGEEPVETAKYVLQFGRENDNSVKVIGGQIEGQLYSAEQVEALSKLPTKNEMRAQLLSVFEAPMSQTLAVMEALLCSVPHCLQNKSEQEPQ